MKRAKIHIKINQKINITKMELIAKERAEIIGYKNNSYYHVHTRDHVTGKYSYKTLYSNESNEILCVIVENI